MDAEDMLYILYTSGTTGKPKGIVHTTGGYLVGTYATTKWVFDLKEDDVYWCTADIGWVTGHSYVVYGPLANGATVVMYEGAPDWPREGSLLGDRRALRRDDLLHGADGDPRVHEVGHRVAEAARPRQPAAARLGRRADQSRSLGLVSPLHRRRALPGRRHVVADRDRRDHDHAAARHHDDQARLGDAAVSRHQGRDQDRQGREHSGRRRRPAGADAAVAVDAARHLRRSRPLRARSTGAAGRPTSTSPATAPSAIGDGFFWLLGRVDDVLNVAGHRIGTMEVESALVDHPRVAEAAVVGRPHEIKGQAVAAFVTLEGRQRRGPRRWSAELKEHVVKKIGAIARPDDIIFTADLPKTRSGKIMRRLLRDIAEGKALGDTTTLADPAVVARLKEQYQDEH